MGNDTFSFTGIIVKQGKRFAALCPEVDVAADGQSAQKAKTFLLEAVSLYLESAIESNLPYLRPVPPEEDPASPPPNQL